MCRHRKKSSIGVHNLASMSFPLSYGTVGRSETFVPLGSSHEMTIKDILEKTETGIAYADLLQGFARVPILRDSTGSIISLPPVINAASTALTAESDGVFVDLLEQSFQCRGCTLLFVSSTILEMGFVSEFEYQVQEIPLQSFYRSVPMQTRI